MPHSSAREAAVFDRIDRFPRWGLTPIAAVTIGLGMLFVQYDIFNINVSFAQTCAEIMAGCTPETSNERIGLPILLSLVGYGIGALTLGPLSDRFGRHRLLIVSMIITGLGSLWSMLAGDELAFGLSRLVTGIGVGADLAIINVYVSEVAPKRQRGRYSGLLFIMAALGSGLGIWLGLILTTPAGPWPQALPFALAGETFASGWRWVYGIGAALAVLSLGLRLALPESPRWLAHRGRLEEARTVAADMERVATQRGPLLPEEAPTGSIELPASDRRGGGVAELLTNRRYLGRLLVLSIAWALAYVTIYSFAGAFTSVLLRQGFDPAGAGMVSAIGLTGFIAAALLARSLIDHVERRLWMGIGAAITLVGALLVASGAASWLLLVGAIVLFFGQNVWFPAQYALTAESFPTRFRTTAYALADSIGHIGGGIGVFILVPLLSQLPLMWTMLGLVAFLAVAALVNLLAPATRHRSLEEISA